DRRLDARVAAADYRHALALVQGSIAVRTIGDAAVAVLELSGNAEIAPAGTGRQDHGSSLQRGAVLHHHFVPTARLLGRNQLLGFGVVHHVAVFGAHVIFEITRTPRALGVLDRAEVLDAHRVLLLPAEALGGD